MQTHNHHIIPKHMGGGNEPDNLIRLTVEQHAMAHKALYEKFGKLEDKIAWLALSGKTDESERLRKKLAKNNFTKFIKDPVRYNRWREKISNTLRGRILTKEHRHKISLGLKLAYESNRRKYVKADINLLRENFNRNREKMAEGRRTSAKWLESVTSDSIRKQKSEMFKGREITWGDKISSSKRGASTKSTLSITIDDIKYPSVAEAARQLNIPRWKLDRLRREQGEFITNV